MSDESGVVGGVDAGSRAIKLVLLDRAGEQVAQGIADQGMDQARHAKDLLVRVMDEAGIAQDHLQGVVATGYGRNRIDWASRTVTEITCHARGVYHLHPDARTVVDIGGQDSKLICLEPDGTVRDFVMNDRCAAGTGRFLEMVATRLETDLRGLGRLARQSTAPAAISNMCVVFAESEIVGLLADGTPAPDIVAGVQHAMAARLVSMAGSLLREPVYFTGGVSLVPGVRGVLEEAAGCPVHRTAQPQFTGALGAALLALGR